MSELRTFAAWAILVPAVVACDGTIDPSSEAAGGATTVAAGTSAGGADAAGSGGSGNGPAGAGGGGGAVGPGGAGGAGGAGGGGGPPMPLTTPPNYFVAQDGDDANPGTIDQPFGTLTKGISGLTPGDTLHVREGTYLSVVGDVQVPSGTDWSNPVTLAAYYGETVVLTGLPNPAHAVHFSGGNHHIVFDGFVIDATGSNDAIKITDGSHHIRIQNVEAKNSATQGILITGKADGTCCNEFIDVHVHHNGTDTQFDHGLYISTDDNVFDGLDVHDNAGYGFHFYGNDDPSHNVVRNSRIHDHAVKQGLGIFDGTDNRVVNNLFYNGSALALWYYPDAVVVEHNTIVGAAGTQVHLENAPGAVIRNNIIVSSPGLPLILNGDATTALVQNNFIAGGWDQASWYSKSGAGTATFQNNFVSPNNDPEFVDGPSLDFHLGATSSAIDNGVTLPGVVDDFDGAGRPKGAGYDIGAFESY